MLWLKRWCRIHKSQNQSIIIMKKLLSLSLLFLVFNCAFPSTKEGMTVKNYQSPKNIGDKIFVKEAKGGSTTLPFWTSEIPNDNFTDAVKESLLKSKTFSNFASNWEGDWGLEIEIVDVDQPFFGTDMTVSTNVKYTLFKKGKKAYETTINASATAEVSDTFFAVKRLRLANERAAESNIQKFIEKISKQNL